MPAIKYYVKVFTVCNDGSPARQQVLPTYANNDFDAENNIADLVETWPEVSAYWIMRISEQPIKLKQYRITVLLVHPTRTKTMKLRVSMENPEEATDIFKAFSEDWDHLVSFEIKSIKPLY